MNSLSWLPKIIPKFSVEIEDEETKIYNIKSFGLNAFKF